MRIIGLAFLSLLAAAPIVVTYSYSSTNEVPRLRAHFDSVDLELRRASSSSLTEPQLASRTKLIEWLRDYRNAGRFPHNDRFRHPMPFFRDSRGVLCAMAYLIWRSGRVDLVDRIAETRNNAFIAELASDQLLVHWLDSVGLSVSEAARIQPTYGGFPPAEDKSSVSTHYALASIAVSGAAATTMGFNLLRPSTTSGVLGLLLGGAAALTGLVRLPAEGSRHTVALTNIAIGSGAVVLGIRGVVEAENRHANRASRSEERARGFELTIVPGIVPSGRPNLGFVMQARF